MSNRTPKILCITGSDGCGKSTIIHALKDSLQDFYEVHIWDILSDAGAQLFDSKKSIYQYLASLSPESRALFLAHALQYSIEKGFQSGKSLILINAYYYKYFAAELALGAEINFIQQLGKLFPEPDAVIRLTLAPEKVLERKQDITPYECGMSLDVSNDAFIQFQHKINQHWDSIKSPKEIEISSERSVESIKNEILNLFHVSKTKIVVVTGLDGSGKSTFFSKLQKVQKPSVAILNVPEIDTELFESDAHLHDMGTFVNALSEHASTTQQPFIKAIALFSSMMLFHRLLEHIDTNEVSTILCERHPLIDTRIYAKFYAPKMDPSPLDPEALQELDELFSDKLTIILEEINAEKMHEESTISGTICRFIYDWFHIQQKVSIDDLSSLFKVDIPNHVYFLEADPAILIERISERKQIELHENKQILTQFRAVYHLVLENIESQTDSSVLKIDAADIESLNQHSEEIIKKYNR